MNVLPIKIQNYRIFIFAVFGFLLFELSFLYFGSEVGFSKLFLFTIVPIIVLFLLLNPFYSLLICLFVLFSGLTNGLEIPYGFFVVVAFTGLSWVLDQAVRLEFSIRFDTQYFWIFGILIAITISGFAAPEIMTSLESLLLFVKLAVFYFLIFQIIQTRSQLKLAILIIIAATVFSILIGIISQFGLIPIFNSVEQGFRLRGLTSQPNVLALHILLIFPFLFLYMFKNHKILNKLLIAVITIFTFFGLLGTFSRSAFLCLIGVGIALLYSLRRNRWLLFIAAFSFIITLILVPEIIWDRISTLQDPSQDASLRWRAKLFWAAINLFIENPIMGIGTGNFVKISHQFISIHLSTHNTILEIATESGLIGLITFGGFFLVSIKNLFISAQWFEKSKDTDFIIFSQGFLASFVGIILFSLFFSIHIYFVIWAFLGLGLCLFHIVKKEMINAQ